jgi:hypothetical protein
MLTRELKAVDGSKLVVAHGALVGIFFQVPLAHLRKAKSKLNEGEGRRVTCKQERGTKVQRRGKEEGRRKEGSQTFY